MKKIINNITLTAFTVIMLAGCSESFIELDPLSENTVSNFYETEDEFNQAVLAVYDAYASNNLQRPLMLMSETRSDNALVQNEVSNLNAFDLEQFNLQADNSFIEDLWDQGYRTIALANIVISRVEGGSFSQDVKNQFLGEALFLRALTYYNLAENFGNIPMPLVEISSPTQSFGFAQENRSVVLSQVKTDLTEAVTLLPEKGDVGAERATKGAARALLGKVHLALDEFSEAATVLTSVTNYSLMPSFMDVFSIENNQESIFELQYDPIANGTSISGVLVPRDAAGIIFGAGAQGDGGQILPTTDLLDTFEDGDTRFSNGFSTGTIEGLERTWTSKYTVGQTQIGFASGANFLVLRYADVLLMRAEALSQRGANSSTEALELVNQVRRRAFGLDINTPDANVDLTTLDTDALLLERRRELAFEAQRWSDLKRFGQAINAMSAATPSYSINQNQLIYPIPQIEININENLEQNPGY